MNEEKKKIYIYYFFFTFLLDIKTLISQIVCNHLVATGRLYIKNATIIFSIFRHSLSIDRKYTFCLLS